MKQQIGIIAKNQEEGRLIERLLSPNDKYYIFTSPSHPVGFKLDGIITTALAHENKFYNEIVEHAEYCIR